MNTQKNFASVYAFVDLGTGRAYIGTTKNDPHIRRRAHVRALIRGEHLTTAFQQAWSEGARFRFVILETCHPTQRTVRERRHILGWSAGTYNSRKIEYRTASARPACTIPWHKRCQ